MEVSVFAITGPSRSPRVEHFLVRILIGSMTGSARSRRASPAPAEGPRPRSSWPWAALSLLLAAAGAVAGARWLEAGARFDNIGGVPSDAFLAYGPVDVVYTWVNGSDPRWKAEKDFWHKHWIASLTGQPLPKRSDADLSGIKGKDDSNSDNRFRDNEELRYSLRSIEKYAPWVRHIYIVTDGQIPSWLDIDSPRLTVVPHRDIFQNTSHLPVFSSPAIEWSLDNIPGLSEWFLYFNDDVFLGAPVFPEDFVSQRGVQKAYFAWEAPLCSANCWHQSLQNGRCDRECNVTACDFDMGDCGCDVDPLDGSVVCDMDKIASIQEQTPRAPSIASHLCQGRCHFSWLGNGHCDRSCNISSCGFDGGDCGVQGMDGASRGAGAAIVLQDLYSADIRANETLVQVPLTVNSTYLNLTSVFGSDGTVFEATHDNINLIRHASLLEQDMLLVLVFGREEETGDPMTSSAAISIFGEDANGTELQLEVSLVRGNKRVDTVVVKNETAIAGVKTVPPRRSFRRRRREEIEQEALAQMLPKELNDSISGGFSTFQNTTIRPRNIRLPFGFRQAFFASSKAAQDNATKPDNVRFNLQTEPELLDVFLPFNITGKKLKDGDVLQLGWSTRLRVHSDDEDEDLDWKDAQSCRLRMPKKKSSPDAAPVTKVESAEETKPVEVAVEEDGVKNFAADLLKGLEQGADSALAKEIQKALAQEEERQKKIQEDQKAQPAEEKKEPVDEMEKDDGIPKCELIEHFDGTTTRRGVRVFIRLPAYDDVASSEVTEEVDDASATPVASSASEKIEDFSETTVVDAVGEGVSEDGMPHHPQIVDGSVCFFDAERQDPKRYCFSLALGMRHTYEQQVVHVPTLFRDPNADRVIVPYQPYAGANPSFLELENHCIDVTLRDNGFSPALCGTDEVPVHIPGESVESKQRAKEREGRRLACEAQRRRLASKQKADDDGKSDDESPSGVIATVKRAANTALTHVYSMLGLLTVEPATEDPDLVEYHDVCDADVHEAEESKSKKAEQPVALLSKDTFGDSLRFVNKLYSRVFGKGSTRRRVPSHMPFMLKRQYIREIKTHWDVETNATSAHRFRHPEDMQFSFSYFHYILNRDKLVKPTLEQIWREYLDANRNGILDENELLTVASLAYGNYPPDSFVDEARECLQPEKREKVREVPTAEGTVRLSETLTPYMTIKNLESCNDLVERLLKNVRREKLAELMSEDEVTFHMLSDNFKFAWNQMLGTRARRTKFVCINDDMKFPTPSVSQILHELFLSIWPKRSQFELPYHLKNRYSHIDEVAKARARRNAVLGGVAGIALLIAFVFRRALLSFFGFHDIARARAASASQLQREIDEQTQETSEGVL